MPAMARLDFLLFFFLLFIPSFSISDRCYFLNGREDKNGALCWDKSGIATGLCCEAGHLCLNNTLCAKRDGSLWYRGSCLDSSWSNPACPRICEDYDIGIEEVYPCGSDFTLWVCQHDDTNRNGCDDRDRVLTLNWDTSAYATAGVKPKPEPVTTSEEETRTSTQSSSTSQTQRTKVTGPGVYISYSTNTKQTSLGASVTSSTTTATTATTATTTTSEPVTTESDSATASSTKSDLAASTAPTATPFDAPQDDSHGSTALPIGVGVVGASVVIAAGIFAFFYLRKWKREAPRRAESPPPFEFAAVGNPARGWLGPSQEPKVSEIQGNSRPMPELGGFQRFELP
ncbi:hypothetical protein VTI74DRAFT_6959 [Chaetomium olivicolor]